LEQTSGSFLTGKPYLSGKGATPARTLIFLICPFIFSFSITCIYQGSREIMKLGGFVASGGPYEISSQAPNWIWIMPVSIMLMMFTIFASLFTGAKLSGPNLMAFSWSAIFVSLGWNFLEFGMGIGMGGRLVWGWLICAILFLLMGLLPVYFFLRTLLRSRAAKRNTYSSESNESVSSGRGSLFLLVQIILAGTGVYLGIIFFSFLN
jgi:hypothetical protein